MNLIPRPILMIAILMNPIIEAERKELKTDESMTTELSEHDFSAAWDVGERAIGGIETSSAQEDTCHLATALEIIGIGDGRKDVAEGHRYQAPVIGMNEATVDGVG